jgi:hypothetical protein
MAYWSVKLGCMAFSELFISQRPEACLFDQLVICIHRDVMITVHMQTEMKRRAGACHVAPVYVPSGVHAIVIWCTFSLASGTQGLLMSLPNASA